jgi:hypothetical protein
VTQLTGDEIEEEAVLQAAFATRRVNHTPQAGSDVSQSA